MDAIEHPLDWWAYGGYQEVMRQLKCSRATARHRVHRRITSYYRQTLNPIWRPIGNSGYATLRRAIMSGKVLDNELR
jgi:hypothetical protein